MATVSLTVNPPGAWSFVSITDSNPSHYVAVAGSNWEYSFVGWKLICHYCGAILLQTSSSTFSDNISARESSGHPGPFELVATFNKKGQYAGTDLTWQISVYAGDENGVWCGGKYIGGCTSSPKEDVWRYDHVAAGTESSFLIFAQPMLGFEFVRWTFRWGTVYDSIEDYYSPTTKYKAYAPLVFALESRTITIGVNLRWVGFIFHAYAHLLTSGSVRIEYKVRSSWRSFFKVSSEGHDVLIDTSIEWNPLGPSISEPSLDWRLTAIEGPGVFKRWSDGGAKQHEVTLDRTSPLEVIAYFYTGQLLYGSSDKLLHGVSGNLVYDG